MPLIVRTTGLDEFMDPGGEAFVKTLVLGRPGSGKTPFGANFPKPFYISTEPGLMSIASKHLPYVSVHNGADMEAAIAHLAKINQRPAAQRPYGTVVVDTVDSYQKLLIQQRLKDQRKPGMERPDWNWLSSRMDAFLHDLMNLEMNVVVLMHDKDFREDIAEGGEEKSRTYKGNALKGDVKDTIYNPFDLIGYMDTYYEAVQGKRELRRHIRWYPTDTYPMLRDRSYSLPEYTEVTFESSDYEQIHDALFGSVTNLARGEDVEEIETAAPEGTGEIAAADQQGGPVADPSLPKAAPAKKTAAAKKTTAAKKAAPAPEQSVATGVEAPKESHPTTAPSTAAEANAKAKDASGADLNEKGTGTAPQDVRQDAQKEVGDKLEVERQERIADRDNPDVETPNPSSPSSPPSSPEAGSKPDDADGEKSPEQQLLEKELGATEVKDEPSPAASTPEERAAADETTGEIPEPVATPVPEPEAAAPAAASTGPICGTPLPGMTPLAEGCGLPLVDLPTVKFSIAQLRTKAQICDGCFDKFKAA